MTSISSFTWEIRNDAADNRVPMGKRTRQALNIIAVIAFILWLGSLFGIFVSVRAFVSAIVTYQ